MTKIPNSHILEQLIQKSNKLVFSFDVDAGTFTFLNSAFELVWNLTREKVYAQPSLLLETLHPEDRDFLFKEFHDLLKGEPAQEIDLRILMPNKEEKLLRISPMLLKDEEGHTVIAGFAEDVTSQRDNIRNLQKFAAKKNSVLEILAHDLAGPLASIQSLSGSLSDSMSQPGQEDDAQLVELIYKTSARSVQMIRDFVKQEFLESSNAGLMKVRLNLVEVINEVMEQYKEKETHILKHFTFHCAAKQIYVFLDQDKFMQVVNNLISNSIKFSHDHAHIDVTLTEQDDKVMLEVKDDGIGIPAKYHEGLFDKFTSARRHGLKGEPSVGLGMSLIKTIVEWHNGRIWFTSEENAGTTFHIELPKE